MADTPNQLDFTLNPGQPPSGESSESLEAKIAEMQRQGLDPNMNPVIVEKMQRDIEYMRNIENTQQPESAPSLLPTTTPELDRLEALQKELDTAKAEATRWKKEFGRREGTVGQMKRELSELKAQVSQITPSYNVQQITGKAPEEYLTAQDSVNLLMSQSQAFGNALRQLREELLAQQTNPADALPLDMEAELIESHPWLTDLPRPQKLRAMQDILASSGVTVTPPAPVATGQASQPATLPAQARAPVRQVAFIEPSNKGSQAERDSIMPERQAYQTKMNQLADLLRGPYKPGSADKAEEILSAMGSGVVDERASDFVIRRH
jgi:hypothetical protein